MAPRQLRTALGLLSAALVGLAWAQAPTPTSVTELELYIGWRSYEEYCSRCHGRSAVGSDFAPALPARMARMRQSDFVRAMEQGYPGLASVLGPWGVENPTLRAYYEPLWAYLTARSRGQLPAGDLRYAPAE